MEQNYTPPGQVPQINDLEAPLPQNHRRDEIKNIVYTVLLFVFAPLFALFMIMFVFQSYVVDGSSMEPTLQNGNRVFILKAQKSLAALKGDVWLPDRHEIIVFKKPGDPSVQLIKRVIGLPGDRVTIQDEHYVVYNSEHPEGFNPDTGTTYGSSLSPTSGEVDIVVGANEVFVGGDNRVPGASFDSRNGVGLIPADNIIGRLWIRYFPLSEFDIFASTLRPILSLF